MRHAFTLIAIGAALSGCGYEKPKPVPGAPEVVVGANGNSTVMTMPDGSRLVLIESDNDYSVYVTIILPPLKTDKVEK